MGWSAVCNCGIPGHTHLLFVIVYGRMLWASLNNTTKYVNHQWLYHFKTLQYHSQTQCHMICKKLYIPYISLKIDLSGAYETQLKYQHDFSSLSL